MASLAAEEEDEEVPKSVRSSTLSGSIGNIEDFDGESTDEEYAAGEAAEADQEERSEEHKLLARMSTVADVIVAADNEASAATPQASGGGPTEAPLIQEGSQLFDGSNPIHSGASKRQLARDELLSSEETYLFRLNVLAENFMNPLLSFVNAEVEKSTFAATAAEARGETYTPPFDGPVAGDDEKIKEIFGNVSEIRDITAVLFDALKDAVKKGEAVGPVFVRLAPFLKLYVSYYSAFGNAQKLCKEMRENNYWFHCFVSAVERQQHCKGLHLSDYLIEPVQRVPRYEMLLKELLKHTPDDHPFCTPLTEAVKTVADVGQTMNSFLGEQENKIKVTELNAKWATNFSAPQRMFVKQGPLIKTDRHGNARKYSFLLFNDLIVYGEDAKAGFFFSSGGPAQEHKVRFQAPLQKAVVVVRPSENESCTAFLPTGTCLDLGVVDDLPAADGRPPSGSFTVEVMEKRKSAQETAQKAKKVLGRLGLDMQKLQTSSLDQFTFLIEIASSKPKTMLLTAETTQERDEWVDAIKDLILALSDQNNNRNRHSSEEEIINHSHDGLGAKVGAARAWLAHAL